MKYLLMITLILFLSGFKFQERKQLTLSDSSQTLFSGQKIQLTNSSFNPLYMHVFVYEDLGPMKHVNLTEEVKGDVMRIESFRLLKDKGSSVWLAILKKENDANTYICEVEEALKKDEIIIIK